MKKTLSMLALLGMLSLIGTQSAEAFSWSSLNPFNWGKCNKCENKLPECPCSTGYATPCDPCEKQIPCDPCQKSVPQSKPCDTCDKLQQQMAK